MSKYLSIHIIYQNKHISLEPHQEQITNDPLSTLTFKFNHFYCVSLSKHQSASHTNYFINFKADLSLSLGLGCDKTGSLIDPLRQKVALHLALL